MILSFGTEHKKFGISMNCINTEITFEFIIPVRNIRLLQFSHSNEGLYRWINLHSHSSHGLDLESNEGDGFKCKLSDVDDIDFWRD